MQRANKTQGDTIQNQKIGHGKKRKRRWGGKKTTKKFKETTKSICHVYGWVWFGLVWFGFMVHQQGHWPIGYSVCQCSGRSELNPWSSHTKRLKKVVLDVALLNTPHYKVRIKDKVEQSREKSSALPLHFGVVAIEKGAFGSPSTKVAK